MSKDAATLQKIRTEAIAQGFHAVSVVSVPTELRRDYYLRWLDQDKQGSMEWMAHNNDRRLHPERLLPEAASIVVLAMNYYQADPPRPYRIAKYALGDDYHNLIYRRLKKLCRFMSQSFGSQQKPYVDTGPLLEKPLAEAAGLGWQGKSTILIEPKRGTWSFLANIVTTLDLPSGETAKDRCGSCTRCIDCCPTQAITAPYQLDARRCIAYLTIEHAGAIPLEYRRAIGDRLYGCDECLDVCPWNKWAQVTEELNFQARKWPSLIEMLDWNETQFKQQMVGSPMRRLKLGRFKRNICVVLGNSGDPQAVPMLEKYSRHADAMIAEHAQWALQEIRESINST